MKRSVLIPALVVIAAIDTGFSQSPSPTTSPSPSPSPPMTCNLASWSPETHVFYGKKDIIVEKLATLSNPSEHRLFVQITQGDSGGTVRLFEREKDASYTVTEWSPRHTSELMIEIDKAIMANKGVNCVGEQIKAILKRLGKGKEIHGVAPPVSPMAAFAHPVKEASGDFIRTMIVWGC